MWSLAHESVADCMVECTSKGWEFGRTSRLGEMPVMKGPYVGINSVALNRSRAEKKKSGSAALPNNSPRY